MFDVSGPERSVHPDPGIWSDDRRDRIHPNAAGAEGCHGTMSRDAAGRRSHPNLFAKLARVLREAGAPGPPFEEPPEDAPRDPLPFPPRPC